MKTSSLLWHWLLATTQSHREGATQNNTTITLFPALLVESRSSWGKPERDIIHSIQAHDTTRNEYNLWISTQERSWQAEADTHAHGVLYSLTYLFNGGILHGCRNGNSVFICSCNLFSNDLSDGEYVHIPHISINNNSEVKLYQREYHGRWAAAETRAMQKKEQCVTIQYSGH